MKFECFLSNTDGGFVPVTFVCYGFVMREQTEKRMSYLVTTHDFWIQHKWGSIKDLSSEMSSGYHLLLSSIFTSARSNLTWSIATLSGLLLLLRPHLLVLIMLKKNLSPTFTQHMHQRLHRIYKIGPKMKIVVISVPELRIKHFQSWLYQMRLNCLLNHGFFFHLNPTSQAGKVASLCWSFAISRDNVLMMFHMFGSLHLRPVMPPFGHGRIIHTPFVFHL